MYPSSKSDFVGAKERERASKLQTVQRSREIIELFFKRVKALEIEVEDGFLRK